MICLSAEIEMMLKRAFIAMLALWAALAAVAQDQLPLSQIAVAHDSVVAEGYKLYYYDKLNWLGTDAYREQCTARRATAMLVQELSDTALAAIYVDVRKRECVFEFRLTTGNVVEAIDQVRPLTAAEQQQLRHHQRLMRAVDAHADSLHQLDSRIGALNLDAVPMPRLGITRVYFMQGTRLQSVIPFGNDCSMDFDQQCRLVGFRRYHPGFVPIDFSTAKKGSVHKTTHPHFEANPLVAPTDVATFLLYGHDGYGMNTFSVYSRPLSCYFTFDASLARILVIKDGQ